MPEQQPSRQQLLEELADLRGRIAVMEEREVELIRIKKASEHILNLAPFLLCVGGLDGYCKRGNPALQRLLGYTEEELLALPCMELVHPDDRPTVTAALERLAEGEPLIDLEERIVGKDGAYHSTTWTILPPTEDGLLYGIGYDVTERKRAERASREHESRAQNLLKTVPLGVYECDVKGRITLTNPSFSRITGYPESELLHMHVWELAEPGPQRDTLPAYLEQLVREQPEPTPYVCQDRTKDGRLIDVQVDWTYKRDDQGAVVGFACVLSDITHVKQFEARLQYERDRAQEILDVAAVMMLTLDRNGAITMLNRKGHEVLGYQQGELVDRDWFDVCLPAAERDELRAAFRQVLSGEIPITERFENRVVTKSGGQRIISWSSSCLTDETNSTIGILSSGEDVTQRRQAEEALAASEEQWRSLVENAPNIILTVDRDGTILFLNHTASGQEAEEVVGKTVYDFMVGDYHDAIRASIEVVFRTGESTTYESRTPESHGSLYFMSRIGPVRKDGKVVAATIIATDITEHKRMEDALQQARDELEERVQQRTAQLAAANARLREDVEERKRLLESSDRDRRLTAYEIHDGLAQQIAAAQMQFQASEQLRTTNPRQAPDAFARGMELLDRGLAETRHLISGLRPPILDESGVVAAIRHLADEPSERDGPTVEVVIDVQFGRLEPVLESTIFRIVQESLTNARRYSQSERVRIELKQQGDHVTITTRDWGIGFLPASVPATCFGLGGVKERARLLGGQATIESAPGKGTTISATLPLINGD